MHYLSLSSTDHKISLSIPPHENPSRNTLPVVARAVWSGWVGLYGRPYPPERCRTWIEEQSLYLSIKTTNGVVSIRLYNSNNETGL